MPRERKQREPKKNSREERIPAGIERQRQSIPEEYLHKGFHQHWINDTGDRLARLQRGGYRFVMSKDEVEPGDTSMTDGNLDMGSRVSMLADPKTGMRAYLMEIPLKLYNQDQAEKQKRRDNNKAMLSRGHGQEQPGRAPIKPGDIKLG